MKNFYKFAFMAVSIALITAAGLTSCTPEDQTGPATPPTKTTNVYVAGYLKPDGESYYKPTLWKNKEATFLSTSNYVHDAYARSVFVSANNDVYVAGYEFVTDANGENGHHQAKLWKNNLVCNLTESGKNTYASAVYEAGGYAYVVGYVDSGTKQAKIWRVALTDGPSAVLARDLPDGSKANSVFVSEGMIYVVGKKDIGSTGAEGRLWCFNTSNFMANNIKSIKLSCTTSTYLEPKSIFLAGSLIYVAGLSITYPSTVQYEAVWWKANTNLSNVIEISYQSSLTPPQYRIDACSIFVSGEDVYIAGNEYNGNGISVAKYWKGTTATSLTNGDTNAFANSVFVLDNVVYTAGQVNNSNMKSIATYWKGSEKISLSTTGESKAESIFVK